jgi:sugar phosphate isomerase/epimerase
MTDQPISVSTAPYDGYSRDRMLESLARIGATHVEPAYVIGYTESFDESAFLPARAAEYVSALSQHGLRCYAVSAHMDLGRADAVELFKGRMDFARRLGAQVVNTFTTIRRREKRFYANMEQIVRHADSLDMVIGLENQNDGSDSLLNVAKDGAGLLARIGSPKVGLNYDLGNTASHRPEVKPAQDAMAALAHCVHVHVKDVRHSDDGWFYTAIGQGDLDCTRILKAIVMQRVPMSIELPLRLHRRPNARPGRARFRVPLADIEEIVESSLQFVRSHAKAEPTAA